MGGIVWEVDDPIGRLALCLFFGLGCGLVLVSTFLLNHFDLFGVRQVYLYLRGKEYTPLDFKTPGFYRIRPAPPLCGVVVLFLGDTNDDGGASGTGAVHDGLYPGGHSV